MERSDVLIAGAGPTGLVLALWLSKQGVKVRIIDKADEPGTTSRALAVQARTLELYRQVGLTEEILARGHNVAGINLWVQGKKATRVPLETLAEGLTPYGPFIYPQDQHERLLITRLEALGVRVERRTELKSFTDAGDHVMATLCRPDGNEACEAGYLAGCDGARSIVRQTLGTGFPGGTYQQVFYVADVDAAGPALDGELHVDLDEADFLAVFPLKGQGRARLIGTVRDERAAHAENLKFEDVRDRAIEHMKVQIRKVNWFSTYHVHHRVTAHFRKGRIFLLGDAAHIHSPAGGQGMNTGIGDAINLAWKLKAVLAGQASTALLDTYETERRAFAQKLVATTDKAFTLATAQGRAADFIRTRIVPLVVPTLFKFAAARHYMFSAVSQLVIAYHDSALSQGKAGDVSGGDRLPWAPSADNFATLRPIGWQVHVYGQSSRGLRDWCKRHGLPLHTFPWQKEYRGTGLARNAMYLLRPDTYVALAASQQDSEALRCYFADRGLSIKHFAQSASILDGKEENRG
ncbi:FAD-dependent oxidoreductase [Phyllobacterium sophorae]|uniref:FAD-dependent oxidoreductase n=2 Tax=Phyllobacterium sophorae TaxID=1520277 RepID=A0A2P7B526_9HYPH|nr:FAD-dependent oxidoreductase [Phyllobacterium sophorae]